MDSSKTFILFILLLSRGHAFHILEISKPYVPGMLVNNGKFEIFERLDKYPSFPEVEVDKRKLSEVSYSSKTNIYVREANVLDRGSFGTVYRARVRGKTNEFVVLKFIKYGKSRSLNEYSKKAAELELALLSKLQQCEHISQCVQDNKEGECTSFEDDHGGKVIVMKYYEHKNLRHYTELMTPKHGKQKIVTSIPELILQAWKGLKCAHELRIMVKDVKPSNILIGRDENGKVEAFLSDFGVAEKLPESDWNQNPSHPSLPLTATYAGTPYTLPPEVYFGYPDPHCVKRSKQFYPPAQATDTWAMGVSLLYSLGFLEEKHLSGIQKYILEWTGFKRDLIHFAQSSDKRELIQDLLDVEFFRGDKTNSRGVFAIFPENRLSDDEAIALLSKVLHTNTTTEKEALIRPTTQPAFKINSEDEKSLHVKTDTTEGTEKGELNSLAGSTFLKMSTDSQARKVLEHWFNLQK